MLESRIFVSIASYCDPMLEFTVRDAIARARNPKRISFGVVDQTRQSNEQNLTDHSTNIAYLQIDPRHSRGACWARALAMTLFDNEDYFLQIDSHTCFDRNWDITLVDALETISDLSGNRDVVLSTRPFGFEIGANNTVIKKRFTPTTLRLVPDSSMINLNDPVLHFSTVDTQTMNDIVGFQVAAAFLFARGNFIEAVPYDPFMYFHGEEQNLSIRAFTNGWDIWHPNRVPLYHYYKSRKPNEAPLHWDKDFDSKRVVKWTHLQDRAKKRLTSLLTNGIDGSYGLGKKRTIGQYLELGQLRLNVEAAIKSEVDH
ncbi:UDP-N-acetylglucosamine-transferase [Phyllobacterium zundukense]|uniref:UDP-N-acetylglucosamine-transferase n=1 Tax=Phyllobacterium zundukense TaxID=1867719 RepID=A0ACD4CX18_9HYPH|nr:UDP-N-acetylglucosamine-transferase [Phyllobacterium zundukense]UXN58114.1 UDP-N-acetylglucosamine-transferase [Phyllobacterium zundukense]